MCDVKTSYNNIISDVDEEIVLEIPLKELIGTIVVYSNEMSNLEKEAFTNYPYYPVHKSKDETDKLIQSREYIACRRDELARLISQYSSFDTQKIWSEVIKLFKEY